MAVDFGKHTLLSNAGATGAGVQWPGGAGIFSVPAGTFGGATVKLQWSPDGTNYLDVDKSGDTNVTLTAAGMGGFVVGPGLIRAVVSGGSPSGLYAYATVALG